jgi:hypothetical protein
MPAQSKKQANLFKAALGKHPKGAAAEIKKSVSKNKIKEFAHEAFDSLVNDLLHTSALRENKTAALLAAAGIAASNPSSAADAPNIRPGVSRTIAPEDLELSPIERLLLNIQKKPTIIDFYRIEKAFTSLDSNVKETYNKTIANSKSSEEKKKASNLLIQQLNLPDNVKIDLIKTVSS